MPAPTKFELERDRDSYREMWLRGIEELTQTQIKMDQMRAVVIELYYSSFWDSDRLQGDTAGYLWTKVKKEFDLTESGPSRIYVNEFI